MEKVLVLLLVALAVAYAVPDPRGIIINLDEGELCLNSAQCTSKCCHREDGLSLARCAPKASENSECSAFTLYGIYYKCPCERGLTCNVDKTIVGSITNTNFGVCLDLGRATEKAVIFALMITVLFLTHTTGKESSQRAMELLDSTRPEANLLLHFQF
ncbi:hypothetical protein E5288_WYG011263 [Bos mutus]|uniref:Colipase n=2 Tax=Bos TaxID=9903 RepID=A0A6B0R5P2_9CETA|nr:hypothetical protein [Bos mutus]